METGIRPGRVPYSPLNTISRRLFAFAQGVDTCQGDSGGPIALRNGNGKNILLGATSYGSGCASTTPGVYAKISDYHDFIRANAAAYFDDAEPAACGDGGGDGGGDGSPATSGEVKSTNYPSLYKNNMNQNYPIIATPGKTIKVTFADFDVEYDAACRYDYVTATDADGTELMSKTCGTDTPPPFISRTNKVNIHLRTDNSITRKGFRASWEEVGNRLTTGEVKSPNYPENYPNNQDSSEVITVPDGNTIEVKVEELNIEDHPSCRYDSVKVTHILLSLTLALRSLTLTEPC